MALNVPDGIYLQEIIARVERDNHLVGMNTRTEWGKATLETIADEWQIDESYERTAPGRINRAPTEDEVQIAIDAIVSERAAVNTKQIQDEADKTRAIELAEKAAVVVDRKTSMTFAELESSHKDLAELVHTMARKLGFE